MSYENPVLRPRPSWYENSQLPRFKVALSVLAGAFGVAIQDTIKYDDTWGAKSVKDPELEKVHRDIAAKVKVYKEEYNRLTLDMARTENTSRYTTINTQFYKNEKLVNNLERVKGRALRFRDTLATQRINTIKIDNAILDLQVVIEGITVSMSLYEEAAKRPNSLYSQKLMSGTMSPNREGNIAGTQEVDPSNRNKRAISMQASTFAQGSAPGHTGVHEFTHNMWSNVTNRLEELKNERAKIEKASGVKVPMSPEEQDLLGVVTEINRVLTSKKIRREVKTAANDLATLTGNTLTGEHLSYLQRPGEIMAREVANYAAFGVTKTKSAAELITKLQKFGLLTDEDLRWLRHIREFTRASVNQSRERLNLLKVDLNMGKGENGDLLVYGLGREGMQENDLAYSMSIETPPGSKKAATKLQVRKALVKYVQDELGREATPENIDKIVKSVMGAELLTPGTFSVGAGKGSRVSKEKILTGINANLPPTRYLGTSVGFRPEDVAIQVAQQAAIMPSGPSPIKGPTGARTRLPSADDGAYWLMGGNSSVYPTINQPGSMPIPRSRALATIPENERAIPLGPALNSLDRFLQEMTRRVAQATSQAGRPQVPSGGEDMFGPVHPSWAERANRVNYTNPTAVSDGVARLGKRGWTTGQPEVQSAFGMGYTRENPQGDMFPRLSKYADVGRKVSEDFFGGGTINRPIAIKVDDEKKRVTVAVENLFTKAIDKVVYEIDDLGRAMTQGQMADAKRKGAKLQSQQDAEDKQRALNAGALANLNKKYGPALDRLYDMNPAMIQNPDTKYKVMTEESNKLTRIQATLKTPTGEIEQSSVAIDRFQNVLNDTSKRFMDFGQALRRNTTEFFRWSLAVSLIYTPLQKMGQLVQIAIDAQGKLAHTIITLGESQSAANKIFTSAYEIAMKTGESVNGVIEGYNQAFRATGNVADKTERYAQANQLLVDSITLAKIAGMQQAAATDALVASLKQMNMPLDQGQVLLDKWVKTSRVANVDVNTLATSFSIVAESATNAGLSVDDLNGLIATVAEVTTLGAREVGNATRALISGYSSDNARKELTTYGIALTNATGEARGFKDVMGEIKALGDAGLITQDQMNRIGMAIGGGNRRSAIVVAALSNLNRMNEVAGQGADSTGEAEKALSIEMNTVNTAVTNLSSSFVKLAMTLGMEGGVLSSVRQLTIYLTELLKLITLVTSAMGTAGPALAVMGIAGKAFGVGRIGETMGTLASPVLTGMGYLGYGAKALAKGTLGTTAPETTTEFNGILPINTTKEVNAVGSSARGWAKTAIQGLNDPLVVSKVGVGIAAAFAGAMAASNGNLGGGIAIALAGGLASWFGGPGAMMIATAVTSAIVSAIPSFNPQGVALTTPAKEGEKGIKAPGNKDIETLLKSVGGGSEWWGKLAIGSQRFARKDVTEGEAALEIGRGEYKGTNAIAGLPATIISAITGRKPKNLGEITAAVEAYKLSTGAGGNFYPPASLEFKKYANPELTSETQQYSKEWLDKQYFDKGNISGREFKTKKQAISGLPAAIPLMLADLQGNFSGLGNGIKTAEDAYRALADLMIKGTPEQIAAVDDLRSTLEMYLSDIKTAKDAGAEKVTTSIGGLEADVTYAEAQKLVEDARAELTKVAGQEIYNARVNAAGVPTISRQDWTKSTLDQVIAGATAEKADTISQLTARGRPDEAGAYKKSMDNQVFYLRLVDGKLQRIEGLSQESITQSHEDLVKLGKIVEETKLTPDFSGTTPEVIEKVRAQLPGETARMKQQARDLGVYDKMDWGETTTILEDSKNNLTLLLGVNYIVQHLLEENNKLMEKSVDGIYNLPEGMSFWLPYSAWQYKGETTGGETGAPTTTPPTATTPSLNPYPNGLPDAYPRGPRGQVGPDILSAVQQDVSPLPGGLSPYDPRSPFYGGDLSTSEPNLGQQIINLAAEIGKLALAILTVDIGKGGDPAAKKIMEQGATWGGEIGSWVAEKSTAFENWVQGLFGNTSGGGGGGGVGGKVATPLEAAVAIATMNVTTMNVGTQNLGVGTGAPGIANTSGITGIVPTIPGPSAGAVTGPTMPQGQAPNLLYNNLTQAGAIGAQTMLEGVMNFINGGASGFSALDGVPGSIKDAVNAQTPENGYRSSKVAVDEGVGAWKGIFEGIGSLLSGIIGKMNTGTPRNYSLQGDLESIFPKKDVPSTLPIGAGAGAAAGTSSVMPKVTTALQLTIDNNQQLYIDGRQLANILKTYIIQDLIRYDAGTGSVRKSF
jgi:TP901 family phage tail tape measure protein